MVLEKTIIDPVVLEKTIIDPVVLEKTIIDPVVLKTTSTCTHFTLANLGASTSLEIS